MCMLSLLLLATTTQSCLAGKKQKTKKQNVETTMTVAAIRPANSNENFIRVTFLQSARFYKLSKDAKPAYLELLKDSEKEHTKVVITRANEQSDIIMEVKK